MNKNLFVLIIMSILCASCVDTSKSRVINLMREWQGKEFHYPTDIEFIGLDGKSVLGDSISQRFKVFSYVDSMGCVSCKLKLLEWRNFISIVDSLYPNAVSFQFVFQPYKVRELQLMLKRDKLSALICIDKSGKFEALNHFPSEMAFQTFLLDSNNKVLAIGNPIHNPKVKELYLKIIRGERVEQENKNKQIMTQVEVDKSFVQMGSFDWQEEQKATFTLKNTGNKVLVIQDIVTSCGCTTVSYSKEPVQPGKEVTLEVAYKAEHPGYFDKTVTVYCNAEGSPLKLRINGNAQ